MVYPNGKRYYRVSVHKSGGYRYASTQPTRVNPVTQKKECRHVHWGTLTEDNKFYPNKNYLMASPEERAQLIFPDDWDLSELDRVPSADTKAAQKYERLLQSTGLSGANKVGPHSILRLIETLEAEGMPSDKIVEIIKLVEV